jgi:hypothetical protein
VELIILSGLAAFVDRFIDEAPRASIAIPYTVDNNGQAMSYLVTADDCG